MGWKKKVAWGAVAAVVLTLAGGYGYGRYRRWQMTRDILPEWTDPGPGPRAPTNRAMGLDVGADHLDTVRDYLAARDLDCPDTSVRAQMQQLREKKKAQVEAAGGDMDAVSGASIIGHKTQHERNPQVRLSCEEVPPSRLGLDREGDRAGRALLVFDSPEHPLRHVSMKRNFETSGQALADMRSAIDAWTQRLGPPTTTSRELPAPEQGLRKLVPVTYEWAYADLAVKLRVVDFGTRGSTVDERIEVPWGIRPDAPTLARNTSAR